MTANRIGTGLFCGFWAALLPHIATNLFWNAPFWAFLIWWAVFGLFIGAEAPAEHDWRPAWERAADDYNGRSRTR